jgi:hypothetical protein
MLHQNKLDEGWARAYVRRACEQYFWVEYDDYWTTLGGYVSSDQIGHMFITGLGLTAMELIVELDMERSQVEKPFTDGSVVSSHVSGLIGSRFKEARNVIMHSDIKEARYPICVLSVLYPVHEVVKLTAEEAIKAVRLAATNPVGLTWESLRGLLDADVDVELVDVMLAGRAV